MKHLYRLFPVFGILCIALSAFAQESKLVVVNTTSKELKRSAHRLRIPVEQLKKARQTLQEATDLVGKVKPYPSDQLFSLVNSWQQLNRSKTKTVIDSLIGDLRSEAAQATDSQTYIQATSTAMSLMQSFAEFDYGKLQQLFRSWPEPPESIAEAAGKLRDSLEANARQNALQRLAHTDPEKALELLSPPGDSEEYNYAISAQIAQGLLNAGKKDEALKIIDQTISDFSQHATDPRALQAYEGFVYMSVRNLDSGRAAAAMDSLIIQLLNQAPSADCGGALKVDDTSVDLTCSESKILNLVRGLPMKPGLVQTTLDSLPALKAKLDSVGGIDSLYSNSGTSLAFNKTAGRQPVPSGSIAYDNPSKLLQELMGKAQSNPGYVKGKLREVAKSQQGIDMLISLGMMASYQDDELGRLALEVAQQLLPQVESLQKRSAVMQNLIRAFWQVDGEVDEGLLRDGFILADQLREEQSKNSESPDGLSAMRLSEHTPADQLEAFLLSELSKDSFESAINYVRSLKNDGLKLICLIQIAQTLSQPNY